MNINKGHEYAVNYPAPLGRGFPAIMANTCTTEM